eukprot:3992188-Amphidinium_carterae.1
MSVPFFRVPHHFIMHEGGPCSTYRERLRRGTLSAVRSLCVRADTIGRFFVGLALAPDFGAAAGACVWGGLA